MDKAQEPLVSICCITYNHEKYIRDAIESFLMQETDFPFEIIIHDDASTDKTADIIREYEKKYPELIKPIYQTENQYSKGVKVTWLAVKKAKGKYIAFCEGDDYWTDPLKLQRQIEFLEKHEDYMASAHQAMVIHQTNKKENHLFKEVNSEILYLSDLLSDRKFHTASFVFRKNIIMSHPLPANIISGDRALYILLSSFGPIKYFSESMCVYRKNDGGISSWVTAEMMKKDLNIIPWICNINPSFPQYRYKSFIHKTIFTYPTNLSYWILIKHYLLFVFYSFSIFPKNIKDVTFTTVSLPLVFHKISSKR